MTSKTSSKNSSSTRLPPKTQQRKQAGKPAKVSLKKILMEENEAKEQLKARSDSLTERLVSILDSGGVPTERTVDIQRQLLHVHDDSNTNNESLVHLVQNAIVVLKEATKALETCWGYANCYPSLNVVDLSTVVDELQTVLCDVASLMNKPLQRKLTNMQADPKADAEVLATLEGVSTQITDLITSTKAALYMTHVRMVVFNKEEGKQAE